jgi:hypothetical protein
MATDIAVSGPKPKYTGIGDWTKMKAAGSTLGKRLGAAGLALTAVDIGTKGANSSNILDGTLGVVSFGAPIVGGVYFVGNLLTAGITGKGIGEHIDENFIFLPTGLPHSPFMPIPRPK